MAFTKDGATKRAAVCATAALVRLLPQRRERNASMAPLPGDLPGSASRSPRKSHTSHPSSAEMLPRSRTKHPGRSKIFHKPRPYRIHRFRDPPDLPRNLTHISKASPRDRRGAPPTHPASPPNDRNSFAILDSYESLHFRSSRHPLSGRAGDWNLRPFP